MLIESRTALLLALGVVTVAVAAIPLESQPAARATRTIQMPVRPVVPQREAGAVLPSPPGLQSLNIPGNLMTWATISASNPVHVSGSGRVLMSTWRTERFVAQATGNGLVRLPPTGDSSYVRFDLRPHTTPVVYAVRCVLELFTQPGQGSGNGTVTAEFPGPNAEQTWTSVVSDNTDNEVTIEFFLSYQQLPNYATAFYLRSTHEWRLNGCVFRVV